MRVVKAMYLLPAEETQVPPGAARVKVMSWSALLMMSALVLWLGVWPSTMIELTRSAVEVLFSGSVPK
jgi:NADH:ubiquinone oxidoreductase subunit 2 (subunit N)